VLPTVLGNTIQGNSNAPVWLGPLFDLLNGLRVLIIEYGIRAQAFQDCVVVRRCGGYNFQAGELGESDGVEAHRRGTGPDENLQ
jgi:hypothetical protein